MGRYEWTRKERSGHYPYLTKWPRLHDTRHNQPTTMPGSSIQSYFSSPSKSGDGFTAEERQSALQSSDLPASAQWTVSNVTPDQGIYLNFQLTYGSRILTMKKRISAASSLVRAILLSWAAS